MLKQTDTVYELCDLVKEFNGHRVLSLPHLVFKAGVIYCLYGTNGSGKTTLFELMTLLQRPTHGRILFKGCEVYPGSAGLADMRMKVTLVHQNPVLFDTTVFRNVDYGLRIRKWKKPQRKKRVRECLKVVGLDGFQQKKARELSGGEAQRVAIARALSIEPEILLLDEFSANIDSDNRILIEKVIRTINKQYGTTIIFTTHYMDQAYRMAESVIHLFKGKAVTSHIRNVYRGIIKKTENGSVFENDSLRIFVATPVKGEASIAVPTSAISVSMRPVQSSMRNCLKGKIKHIIDDGNAILLRVNSGAVFEIAITRESFSNMQLQPGSEVYLNFKASSVEVL